MPRVGFGEWTYGGKIHPHVQFHRSIQVGMTRSLDSPGYGQDASDLAATSSLHWTPSRSPRALLRPFLCYRDVKTPLSGGTSVAPSPVDLLQHCIRRISAVLQQEEDIKITRSSTDLLKSFYLMGLTPCFHGSFQAPANWKIGLSFRVCSGVFWPRVSNNRRLICRSAPSRPLRTSFP